MAKEMGVLLLLFAAVAMAARPQLVNSDVWVSDSRIIATDFQTISGNLEFDQPLYLAESLLCPQAEQVRGERDQKKNTINHNLNINHH